MNIQGFTHSFINIVGMMSPYLLLGFLIAGILHIFVPKKFYKKYLSKDNKLSVVFAALLGVPLPLCSCGVIPTAVGLKNEGASKGAVASFLIATPQTGVDSILATFSLMGLGFAVLRPAAALITGICGGFLVNILVKNEDFCNIETSCKVENKDNKIIGVLKYSFIDMFQNIGLRLFIGLLIAAIINIAVPDDFFLQFGNYPLLQMLIILAIAIPMYICSTGSIPITTTLVLKGLSPGAALVMLMAGPAVNMASILVLKKNIGNKFTVIYIMNIVLGSIIFGFITNILNNFGIFNFTDMKINCCAVESKKSLFASICSIVLILLLVNALILSLYNKLKKEKETVDYKTFRVEGMHCSHCKKAVEEAVMNIDGIETAEANVSNKTLIVKGKINIDKIEKAVNKAGFELKKININR